MRDFDRLKQQIIDRVDLVDLVSEHVSLKRVGKAWVGLCCFHDERTPSLRVTPELGIFKCFGCGKGGDVFSFVQYRENVSFGEALRLLADRAGVDLGPARAPGVSREGVSRSDVLSANSWAAKFFRNLLLTQGAEARSYLRERGISETTEERFSLGLAWAEGTSLHRAARAAGISHDVLDAADLIRRSADGRVYDTFRNRLMFPIRDASGRVIGFGGRTLADDPAKYLNTRATIAFDKGTNLFGIDLARHGIAERSRAILVEGYTDCLAAHQAGFSETVATLGTALTETQVALLRRYSDRVIILFDSDQAGEAAAERAINVALPRCMQVFLARIPDGKDPCDFLLLETAERFRDVLNEGVAALEFKWFATRRRFRADEAPARRREAVEDFLNVVSASVSSGAVDAIEMGNLVNQVAHLLDMPGEQIHHLLARKSSRRRVASAGPDTQAPAGAVQGERQDPWILIGSVLLNDPTLVRFVPESLDGNRITDERDRRVVCLVLALARKGELGRLMDVLTRLQDSQDVHLASNLAQHGADLPNLEGAICAAVGRLRQIEHDRAVEQAGWRLRQSGFDASPEQEYVRVFLEGRRKGRSFVPPRLARQVRDAADQTEQQPVAAQDQIGSVEQP